MAQKEELTTILAAGSILVESSGSSVAHDLKSALLSRLARYHNQLGHHERRRELRSLEEIELETAQEAIYVVDRVQAILNRPQFDADDNAVGAPSLPLIGTRDLAELRILLSIVFKWGVQPLLGRVISTWPRKPISVVCAEPQIIDLTAIPESYHLLSSIVIRLMRILFPGGVNTPMSQTSVAATILNHHLSDILRPSLALGWLPKWLASESMPTIDEIRPLVMCLLATLSPSQSMTALGAILSGSPAPPSHVNKTCTSLLTRQLLRPEGVLGLCIAVFGDDDETGEDAEFEKLNHVSRILSTVPAGMKREEYFESLVPRILALLDNQLPSSHKRAAAFAISRMLSTDENFPHRDCVTAIIFSILHTPFLQITQAPSEHAAMTSHSPSGKYSSLSPGAALLTLVILSTNMDPSPTLMSSLLSPIVSALYSLLAHMDHVKTSDPVLKESLRSLLGTWGRVSGSQDGINALWDVVNGGGGEWEVLADSDIRRIQVSDCRQTLSLLTPGDLRQPYEEDYNSNLLNLRPDPVHFVRYLKSIDRPDVCSELFVRVLEAYRCSKSQEESDPIRTIMFLQLVIQMQTQLSDGNSSSNILRRPEHILSFIKHALESSIVAPAQAKPGHIPAVRSRIRAEDLSIVDQDKELSDPEGDSDDESPMSQDDEMIETAVNLLLSILEANEDLSARTAPVLSDILTLLDPLTNDVSHSLRSLVREARLVMTVRLASASAPRSSKFSAAPDEEDVQEMYQRALRLLQDPILPVRAHGLLLLRQLVSSLSSSSANKSRLDPALVPAIVTIFVQAIQHDDSYMFLNAVHGLAAMVDVFGKEVLQNLISIYVQGLDGIAGLNITQNDVDTRLRVGEALGQVIRRYGAALVIYAEILIPPLFNLVRSAHVPTTLRASALSLLGDCANTDSLSLLPYMNDLLEAMIDLLQVESVAMIPRSRPNEIHNETERSTSTKSKSPSLRRAALHFLSLAIRATTIQLFGASGSAEVQVMQEKYVKRVRTLLSYTAATDENTVVRVMARETLEALEQMQQAMIFE